MGLVLMTKGGKLGLTLAVAIALHNIPEGVAVAMPVYFATRSRWQVCVLSLAATMFSLRCSHARAGCLL